MTDLALKLDTAVGLLTRESKHRLVDSDGSYRWVTADPLLLQLRIAVRTNSAAPPAFKASAGVPLPLNAVAHDLLQEIAETVLEHWWRTYRLHHGKHPGSLANQIRAWAMAARAEPALLSEAEHIMSGWVRQIQGLFDPVRRWEVKGRCPECDKSKRLLRLDDEGSVYAPVLSVTFDKNGELQCGECLECGATWRGSDLVDLARQVASQ
jgi:hypothetical protein